MHADGAFEPAAASGSGLLREELSKLKNSELKKRAKAAGAFEEHVDAVDDADDPKAALIDLVVGLEPAPEAATGGPATTAQGDKNARTLQYVASFCSECLPQVFSIAEC